MGTRKRPVAPPLVYKRQRFRRVVIAEPVLRRLADSLNVEAGLPELYRVKVPVWGLDPVAMEACVRFLSSEPAPRIGGTLLDLLKRCRQCRRWFVDPSRNHTAAYCATGKGGCKDKYWGRTRRLAAGHGRRPRGRVRARRR